MMGLNLWDMKRALNPQFHIVISSFMVLLLKIMLEDDEASAVFWSMVGASLLLYERT